MAHASRSRAQLIGFAVLLAACVLGLPVLLGGPAPFVFELGLLALGIAIAARTARACLPRSDAIRLPLRVAIAMMLLVAAGQLARSKRAFPLMPYTMYGRALEGPVLFYRYHARLASGREVPFFPSRVVPTLGNGRIAKGLQNALEEVASRSAGGAAPEALHRRLTQTLRALCRIYNAEHARDPVVALEIERVVLPPPYAPSAASSQRVYTLGVEPDR